MADKKVGTSTGKKTQAGRDVYKTPEGEMVSEKSTTFKYKGMWINIPSIHNGHKYDDATLKLMLEAEIIKPTSSHKSREDAEQAARKRSDNLKFNKGGTAMKDQMSFFEDGGLKDEGGMVDEVSGNEVPSGSTRKEVRDDIPANISEGEFIFPADVVRFIGLEKLMQMRQMAKMGLKEMEAMGQMGNSDEATMPDDLPFGMADLIIVEGEDDSEENNFAVGGIQWPVSPADVPIETKVYINEAGNKINIRFQGDKPLDTIPDGYVLFTGEEVTPEPVVRQGGDGSSSGQPAPKNPFVEAGSWQNAPLDMYIKELDKFTGYTPSVVAGLAGALGGPLIGAAVYAGNKLNKKQILATIDERIEQAKKTDVVGQVAALRAAKDKLMGKGEKENTSIFGKIINTVKGALGLTDEQVKTATTTAANVSNIDTSVTLKDKKDLPTPSAAVLGAIRREDAFTTDAAYPNDLHPEEKAALGVPPETKIDPTSDLVDAYDYIAKKQQEETRKRVAETEQNIDPVTPTLYGASPALGIADTSTAPQIPVAAPQVLSGYPLDRPADAGMTTGSRALLPIVASAESNQAKQQLADIQAQAAQNVLDVVKNAVTGTQVTAPLVGTTMEVDGSTPRESGIQAAALTPSRPSEPKPQSRAGATTTPPPVSRDRDRDRDSSPISRPTPKQAAKKATKEAKIKTANLSPTQKTGGAELDKAYGISGLAKGGMPKKKRGLAARK
jgi:hypothetical protein